MFYAGCLYAECLYAECLYAECLYAKCLYLYAECRYAECRYAECHCAIKLAQEGFERVTVEDKQKLPQFNTGHLNKTFRHYHLSGGHCYKDFYSCNLPMLIKI
jgi:hypothetical protein